MLIGVGIVAVLIALLFSPLVLYFAFMAVIALIVYGWIVANIGLYFVTLIAAAIARLILRFAGRNVLIAYIGFWAL